MFNLYLSIDNLKEISILVIFFLNLKYYLLVLKTFNNNNNIINYDGIGCISHKIRTLN